jgi:predicted ATPase
MLLILDNYEHLLPESQFIEQLLMQAPRVTLLITSRERLSLRREWIYTVQGLPVYAGPIPDPSTASAEQALRRMSSAVQLFVQSARRVHPSFILEQETVGQIVKICDLLEGMPLGIELAASWSRLLSCGDIFDHLQDSMDLLTTSMRDIPERHRSLRAIFDNSWGLLTETEQDVLAKLSVFRGGFTLESAIQVVGTSVPMLAAMLDKSLLRLAQDGRYDQHELLRQYTQERLAESSAMQQTVRDRHARHYAHYMLLAAQRGIGTPDFMAMIATEIDNIRQAWRLAMVRQDYAVLAQFILGLGYFYEVQGWRQEASEVFTAAYEAMRPHVYPIALSAADKVQVFATLLAWMGFFYPERDAEKSFQLQNEALTLMRPVNDGLELATALTFRARSANDLGEYELARQDLEECLAILHRINMLEGQSVPLQFLGINYRRTGRYAESIRCHREALAISQIAKIDRMNSAALADLSIMSLLSGDPQEARRLAVQALHICQQSGDVHLQGLCYTNLALAVFALGDFAEAKAALVSALEKSVYLEMNIHLAVVLAWLARTHLALDELEQAQDYLIQALRTSLLPGYRRAFGVVLNTAGILLATRGPELAHVLWRAIQQDDTLYYEDRQEATDLLAQTFSPEERAAFADEPVPNFPALIRHTLTLLG